MAYLDVRNDDFSHKTKPSLIMACGGGRGGEGGDGRKGDRRGEGWGGKRVTYFPFFSF